MSLMALVRRWRLDVGAWEVQGVNKYTLPLFSVSSYEPWCLVHEMRFRQRRDEVVRVKNRLGLVLCEEVPSARSSRSTSAGDIYSRDQRKITSCLLPFIRRTFKSVVGAMRAVTIVQLASPLRQQVVVWYRPPTHALDTDPDP